MTSQTVTYSGNEPITLAEAKAYLRVDFDADDMLIQSLIDAARSHAEDYTNLAIRSKTVKATFDRYQQWYYLNGPVVSITSVTVVDDKGQETVVADEDRFCNKSSLPAKLYLTGAVPDSCAFVTIVYEAGFSDTVLPDDIRNAILHMVGDWYANREDGARRFPTVSTRLLDLQRRNYFA